MDEEGMSNSIRILALRLFILRLRKFDLFSKDVVLIPVNHNNAHWTAAAINFRKKRIQSYDSMGTARSEVHKVVVIPFLIIVGFISPLSKALRKYLDDEHQDKKKKPFDFTGWVDWIDGVRLLKRTVGPTLMGPTPENAAARERLRLRCFHMSIPPSLITGRGG